MTNQEAVEVLDNIISDISRYGCVTIDEDSKENTALYLAIEALKKDAQDSAKS